MNAIDLAIDRGDLSLLEKDILKRKLRKLAKNGGLAYLHPLFQYRLCCARFALKDLSDYTGWEWRSGAEGWSFSLSVHEQPLPGWDGGHVERLWVIGEGGIGDEIFYASMFPDCLAKVKEVVYECDSRLHTIIERSFPKIKCVPRTHDWKDRSGVYIPAGDLLRVFRRNVKQFTTQPYLRVDGGRRDSLRQYAGRIGVAARGRQGSLDPFKFTLERPLSVQYGEPLDGIESPELDLTNDIEGVFALVSLLKKVVTVPQSVHHFAGSVGVPVDIILPDLPGKVNNQIKWETEPGPLPWYRAFVYHNIEEWHGIQRTGRPASGRPTPSDQSSLALPTVSVPT